MSNSQVERHPKETEIFIGDSGTPQATHANLSWKLLLFCACMSLVLAVLGTTVCNLVFFPRQQVRSVCLARATNPKSSVSGSVDWNWTLKNCSGHIRNNGNKLEVLKHGIYIVFVHVTHTHVSPLEFSTHDERFTVQITRESNGTSDIFKINNGINCTDCTPYISMGHPYELWEGDQLYLKLNNKFNVIDSENTFWGVYEVAPVIVPNGPLYQ
ncbi:tumor necrosis factor ligand superfamily member 18-like [Ambystoma mexicanum]|uniref:tumor necrosis factor ligand superfamily member 18-like n=1 Tax=Ambystoma mexicanum TaxID=8296 RepID=UPI0037E74C62